MSETAVLLLILGPLWGITLALVGVVWSMLTGRIAAMEKIAEALVAQNTMQEASLAGLTQRMIGRENAHEEHRSDVRDAIASLAVKLDALQRSINELGRGRTPYPGRYGTGSEPERK